MSKNLFSERKGVSCSEERTELIRPTGSTFNYRHAGAPPWLIKEEGKDTYKVVDLVDLRPNDPPDQHYDSSRFKTVTLKRDIS